MARIVTHAHPCAADGTAGVPARMRRALVTLDRGACAKSLSAMVGLCAASGRWPARVTFWGVSDADSWLNRGRTNHPLLWDRQRKPKPAFDAVAAVLAER